MWKFHDFLKHIRVERLYGVTESKVLGQTGAIRDNWLDTRQILWRLCKHALGKACTEHTLFGGDDIEDSSSEQMIVP